MDALIIITALGGLLILPAAICKLWYWFWFFICVAILLGIFEAVAVVKTGKTISQQFWAYLEKHKTRALICAGLWLLFFVYLVVGHLILGM